MHRNGKIDSQIRFPFQPDDISSHDLQFQSFHLVSLLAIVSWKDKSSIYKASAYLSIEKKRQDELTVSNKKLKTASKMNAYTLI